MPVFKGEGKVSRLWWSHVVWLTCFYKHVCLLILLKAWVPEQRNCGVSCGRQKYVMEAWNSFKMDLSVEMWHETAPLSISVPGGSSSFPTSLGTTQLMLQWFAAAEQQLLLSMCCSVLHKACRSFLGSAMFLSLSSCGSDPLAWYCCPWGSCGFSAWVFSLPVFSMPLMKRTFN